VRPLERIDLLNKIGRTLQGKMTFAEIDQYLRACNIDLKKSNSGRNSKWVYSKEMLDDASDALLSAIAEELEIEHEATGSGNGSYSDSRFWTPGCFKLFISHVSVEKIKATSLKSALKEYLISGFVAHEDIHPTLEWQSEIEKALFSMDALAAILTPNFHDSLWTDQEIGFALGRNAFVVAIRAGKDPYGFTGKFQGIPGKGKKASEVARLVFESIVSNRTTRTKMANILIENILTSTNIDPVMKLSNLLEFVSSIPTAALERLRDNFSSNPILCSSSVFIDWLNHILASYGLDKFSTDESAFVEDTEIPF